jgi:hypothetical protein
VVAQKLPGGGLKMAVQEVNLLSADNEFLGTCKVTIGKSGELPRIVSISKQITENIWERWYFLQCPNSLNVYYRTPVEFCDYKVRWKNDS